jgi:hypothetical protein
MSPPDARPNGSAQPSPAPGAAPNRAAAPAPDPAAAGSGAPECPQCERLLAERNRYRTALTEMACSVGWPIDREAHLREIQQLAHQTLGMSWDRPFREPTPVIARLAYGKQPGARPESKSPAWLRRITKPIRALLQRLR